MSLWADYFQEKTGNFMLELPQGFATYRFESDEKTVYIMDIYVIPAARKSGVASDIADRIVRKAKDRGCTRLLGSVTPSARGSTDSLRFLMSYGMRLDSSAADFILFYKEI